MMLKAKAFLPNQLSSASQATELRSYVWSKAETIRKVSPGLNFAAYEARVSSVTELDRNTPVKKGVAETVDIKYSTRKEYTGLRFEGLIKVNDDALYNFFLASDDGSVLWIDGQGLINSDGPHSGEEKSAAMALRKGYHKIKVAHFQAGGGSELVLQMSMSGQPKKEIPPSMLFHE